jgi:BlaI family transcriptional regulator, penicillinase repressor
MPDLPSPTERELEILKILWDQKEASVREVYERMRDTAPIVQNTVQAFLRTMEEKGLVRHRLEGRSFIYSPAIPRAQTTRRMASEFVQHVFDGAIDQLVETVFSHRPPTEEELTRLEALLAHARSNRKKHSRSERGRE